MTRKPQIEGRKTKKELRASHHDRMKRRVLAASQKVRHSQLTARFSLAVVVSVLIGGTALLVTRVWYRPTITTSTTVIVPELSARGMAGVGLYSLHCSGCHGENAAGSPNGPPLVDKLYGPRIHNNDLFRHVIAYGVTAHHWKFGDMPAVKLLRSNHRDRIIDYVRELQRANGIE